MVLRISLLCFGQTLSTGCKGTQNFLVTHQIRKNFSINNTALSFKIGAHIQRLCYFIEGNV